jgi:hypothetical protein
VARAELKDEEVTAVTVSVAVVTASPGALAEPEVPPAGTAMQTAPPAPVPVPPVSVRVPAAASPLACVPLERREATSPLAPAMPRRPEPVPSTPAPSAI